ncbi:MAG TPA: hypothetical protein VKV02_06270 [Acidobacteriaceae bacterium]|nr:hypothetical protein [Acidobacteriaceae bacterium]
MVGGGIPVDDYLERFQHEFPTITRRDMSARFMRVMIAFGLAVITDNRLMLTAEGSDYLNAATAERRKILAGLFTERIYGAAELADAGIDGGSDAALQLLHKFTADGGAPLKATQVRYLIAWANELGLLKQGQSRRPK